MDSKFATLELQVSITYNADNQNAVDKDQPLPFLDWVKYFANIASDPTFLLRAYKNYVNEWFNVKKDSTTNKQDVIQSLYISLFRNIAVNYLTQEEKRFVKNANLNSNSEITAILPLFVRKIKDICLYFASQRENVKYSTYLYNLKSSPYSVEKNVTQILSDCFLDPDINKMFADYGVSVDDIKNKLSVEIESLYDLETNYFDINPELTGEDYDATGKRLEYFNANSYEFDKDLFVDFDQSVVKAIEKYPVILQELGSNFSVNLNFTSQDLQYLKDEDFTTLVNNLDTNNLRLQTLKEALQHFSGSTFYYLSTNSVKEFAYSKLFDANTFANYLNRRFPTVAVVESNKLTPVENVGRFFTPDKRGVLNYLNFNLNGSINTLSADHIYIFPDPDVYGNISGLSRTKLETPFIFSEDSSVLKNNVTNSYAFGNALTDFLTKFRGYQSRSESLQYDATGISRIQDPQEFFKGDDKTRWANEDVFPIDSNNAFPIDQRKKTLLSNLYNKSIYQHKTDIFNNEFSLFKEIYVLPNPEQIKNNETSSSISCLDLDGSVFYDSVSGFNFNFDVINLDENLSGVTLNTNGLTALSSYDYVLQCIPLYPENDFCKTKIIFNISQLDGLNFGPYPEQSTLTELLGETFEYEGLNANGYYSYIHSASSLESGPFQFNQKNASFIDFDRSLLEPNLLIGTTLSSADTILYNISGSLTEDITLYNQLNLYGDLYYRNYNSTLITPASAALSALFVKYDNDIQFQIFNKLKNFDLILDTIILETDNYLIFERLSYDYDTEIYLPQPSSKFYIYKSVTNIGNNPLSGVADNVLEFNHFTNTWYNETDNTVLVAKTTLLSSASATNSKAITIDLFQYDFETLKQLNASPLATFTLTASPLNNVNIVTFEKPILNYDNSTGNYIIKFLTKDPSQAFFDSTLIFKLDKTYNPYNVSFYTQYPDFFIFSENFGSQTFSSYFFSRPLIGSNNYIGISGNSWIIN